MKSLNVKNIIFSTPFLIEKEYYPVPASKVIPDWYKKMESYVGGKKSPDGNGNTTATIKKCMPVFDAITSGYILFLPADLYVSQKDNMPYFEWSNFELVSFHGASQLPSHPDTKGHLSIPKLMNPWNIETPSGYSTLFIQPLHRESVFNILPGVVDTDTYTAQVNFPFALNDITFTGLIPAGTPMAQVIPFKRESWSMNIGEEKETQEAERIRVKLKSRFFDRYKTMFWHLKEYK